MRQRDLDRERSEERRTLDEFLRLYNENLPAVFPRASVLLLEEFKNSHAGMFKATNGSWSLDQHRKKVMDWLRATSI